MKYDVQIRFEPVELVKNVLNDATVDRPCGYDFLTYEEAEESIIQGWHGTGTFSIRKVYRVDRSRDGDD